MSNLIKIDDITKEQLASICDHTFLNTVEQYFEKGKQSRIHPTSLRKIEYDKFMDLIQKDGLVPYSVCVHHYDVEDTRTLLDEKGLDNTKIASVVGFPDGIKYNTSNKVFETKEAIRNGANEVDMVLNNNYFINNYDLAVADIEAVVSTAHKMGAPVKVILENKLLLDPKLIKKACILSDKCGADFVKTSTGYDGGYGAKTIDIEIMKKNFPKGVKASGGVNINNYKAILKAMSGRNDGYIDLDPMKIRIGESGLMKSFYSKEKQNSNY